MPVPLCAAHFQPTAPRVVLSRSPRRTLLHIHCRSSLDRAHAAALKCRSLTGLKLLLERSKQRSGELSVAVFQRALSLRDTPPSKSNVQDFFKSIEDGFGKRGLLSSRASVELLNLYVEYGRTPPWLVMRKLLDVVSVTLRTRADALSLRHCGYIGRTLTQLNAYNEELGTRLCQAATAQLQQEEDVAATDVCMLTAALAQCRHVDADWLRDSAQVLTSDLASLTPKEVIHICWAHAVLGSHSPLLFDAVFKHVMDNISFFSTSQLCRLCWSSCVGGYGHTRTMAYLQALALRPVFTFNSESLAQLYQITACLATHGHTQEEPTSNSASAPLSPTTLNSAKLVMYQVANSTSNKMADSWTRLRTVYVFNVLKLLEDRSPGVTNFIAAETGGFLGIRSPVVLDEDVGEGRVAHAACCFGGEKTGTMGGVATDFGTAVEHAGAADTNLMGTDANLREAVNNLGAADTDSRVADTSLRGTDTDLRGTDTDLRGTDTDLRRTDTDLRGTDTDAAAAHRNVGKAHLNVDAETFSASVAAFNLGASLQSDQLAAVGEPGTMGDTKEVLAFLAASSPGAPLQSEQLAAVGEPGAIGEMEKVFTFVAASEALTGSDDEGVSVAGWGAGEAASLQLPIPSGLGEEVSLPGWLLAQAASLQLHLPEELCEACGVVWAGHLRSSKPSRTQEQIAQVLGALQYGVVLEAVLHPGLPPVDLLVISREGDVAMIEVDGPTHYSANQPHVPLGTTSFRRECLRLMVPAVRLVVVPYYEWDAVPVGEQQMYLQIQLKTA